MSREPTGPIGHAVSAFGRVVAAMARHERIGDMPENIVVIRNPGALNTQAVSGSVPGEKGLRSEMRWG